MKLWPFRKKEPPPPEDDPDELFTITATPFAGLVYQMLAWGCPPHVIVWVVQQVETERAGTAARVRAEMNLSASMSTEYRPDKTDTVSTEMSTKMSTRKRPAARRAKWRELKRNQRSKLRLVSTSKSTTG